LAGDAVAQIEITVSTGSTSQNFNTLITAARTSRGPTIHAGLGLAHLDGWSLFTYTNWRSAITMRALAEAVPANSIASARHDTERALGGVGLGEHLLRSPDQRPVPLRATSPLPRRTIPPRRWVNSPSVSMASNGAMAVIDLPGLRRRWPSNTDLGDVSMWRLGMHRG
jgi:hypothetical protein